MNQDETSPAFETAAGLYREIRARGLHLRSGNGRDDALIEELCDAIGCPNRQLASYLEQEEQSAEWFLREFLKLAAPFARMFSEIWEFLSSERGPRATEEIRIRFGFEEDDQTDMDLEEFREWAKTARDVWTGATMAYWSQEALHDLFELGQCVEVEHTPRVERYHPGEPYQLPPIEAHHGDEFEGIVRRIRDLFQNIIDHAAALDREEYSPLHREQQEGTEDSAFSIHSATIFLTDALPTWVPIFLHHGQVAEDDRREAVTFYTENIEPKLETESVTQLRSEREPLEILRLPFWKHRWHTYEIWATVQTLEALTGSNPQARVVDGRIPIDGRGTEVVADLDIQSHPGACVVTELETPYEGEERTAIRPDLNICRNDSLDAASRAVVIEYKQRASLSRPHVKEVAQSYLSGSPKAAGLVMVNYDAATEAQLPEAAQLLGNVRPGTAALEDFRETVKEFTSEAGLLHHFQQEAVLVDVSGSMGEVYADPEVQQALMELLNWADRGLDVYRFNVGLLDLPRITANEVEGGLETGGGTDVERALQDLCQESDVPRRVLVVTDGQNPLPDSPPLGVDFVKECEPKDLPSELEWLRRGG